MLDKEVDKYIRFLEFTGEALLRDNDLEVFGYIHDILDVRDLIDHMRWGFRAVINMIRFRKSSKL